MDNSTEGINLENNLLGYRENNDREKKQNREND